jgi:hypothetical protein
VKDLNGNQLGRQYRFSFTPEPNFRVTSFSFNDGDTLNPGQYQSVGVFFNSKINARTLSSISLQPPVSGSWNISYDDSMGAYFSASEHFMPSTKATVVVAPNTYDAGGNQISQAVSNSFYSMAFRLSHVSPYYITTLTLLASPEFYFTYPLDSLSASSAVTVSPNIPFTLQVEGNSIKLTATNDFKPITYYTVAISSILKNSDGAALQKPVAYNFNTTAFQVSYHEVSGPRTSFAGYSRLSSLVIDFTGAIDTSSFKTAFSISPPVDGVFAFQPVHVNSEYYLDTYEAYFAPKTYLPPFTTYHVKIDNTVRSIAGFQLEHPDTFSFTTGGSLKENRNRRKLIPIK